MVHDFRGFCSCSAGFIASGSSVRLSIMANETEEGAAAHFM